MIKTIKENVNSEIIVKKSKFIANIFYVESEDEAQKKIKDIQKKYNDAKHNCYAYVLQEIDRDNIINIQKSSDNGEPSGTAGAPLMDLLKKQEIYNTLIIVTRYFGGILLGTGGLVKAYTESAILALEKTQIIKKEIGNQYEVIIDYDEFNDFKYNCNKIGIKITETKYEETIKAIIETTTDKCNKLILSNNNELNIKKISGKKWV